MGILSFFVSYVGAWLRGWLFVYLFLCVVLLGSASGIGFADGTVDSNPLRHLLVVDLLNALDIVRLLVGVLVVLPLLGSLGGIAWKILFQTRSLWKQFVVLAVVSIILNLACAFGVAGLVHAARWGFLAQLGAWVLVFVGLSFFGFIAALLFFMAGAGDFVQDATDRFRQH
ncbi:MAG: hypothetical protein Q7R47_01180 [Candidatus Diapherotrites archaeon]|nr:hypothetical protein [Candidatus Diapherotrites archaeon]